MLSCGKIRFKIEVCSCSNVFAMDQDARMAWFGSQMWIIGVNDIVFGEADFIYGWS